MSEVNRVIREFSAYHLRPIKNTLGKVEENVEAHIQECALRQAKIEGALSIIKWMATGLYAVSAGALAMLAHFMGWM